MQRMTGTKFFAEYLKAYGVSHVFFMPTIITRAMAEMEDMGIQRITTHGEKAAAYMADGYARALLRPGICLAQNVGAANLAAGLRDAYLACSPVIAVTGGADAAARYRHVYQEVEDFTMFDRVTKFNAQVDKTGQLPHILSQAFRVATSGAPGPVHVRLQGRHGQAIEEEDNVELIVDKRFMQVPPFRPEPEPEAVAAAIEALLQARKPVIVAGGGVIASQATQEVRELAEKLSIPVATSLNAKGTIPDHHPLSVGVVGTYSRSCANRFVAEADLVFFIGSHTGSQVTNNWKIPRIGTPVIQLDIEPAEIGRSYPAAVGIVGDAKIALRKLMDRAVTPRRNEAWLARLQQFIGAWRAEVEGSLNSEAIPIRPERICKEISEFLPPDAVLVADTGHAGIWTGTMVDLQYPTQRYIRCAGSLGWAFPGSIGVKCALPDRPVLCFTGDGGFYYHLAELETAARFGINIVVLVNNNHALSQERRMFNAAYGGTQRGKAHDMWIYKETNFAKVAEAMGCLGIRVEKPAELSGALACAFAANRPVLIDVVSDIETLYARPWG